MLEQTSIDIQEFCAEISALDDLIAELKEQIKAHDRRRAELESAVVGAILNGNKFQSTSFAGGRTVYKSVITRPGPKRSRPELVKALKLAGPDWAALVKEDYNANTLWHHTNELRDVAIACLSKEERPLFNLDTLIPEALREDLVFDTTVEIRSRRG